MTRDGIHGMQSNSLRPSGPSYANGGVHDPIPAKLRPSYSMDSLLSIVSYLGDKLGGTKTIGWVGSVCLLVVLLPQLLPPLPQKPLTLSIALTITLTVTLAFLAVRFCRTISRDLRWFKLGLCLRRQGA